jgi:hypothetical protein
MTLIEARKLLSRCETADKRGIVTDLITVIRAIEFPGLAVTAESQVYDKAETFHLAEC